MLVPSIISRMTVIWVIVALVPMPIAMGQFGDLFSRAEPIPTIATGELAKMIESRRLDQAAAGTSDAVRNVTGFVLVDVRSPAETAVSMIPGAITKSVYESDRHKYDGWTVIPYCTVGGRSGAYAKKLAKKEVTVRNYEGSILQWIDAGLPLVTPDGKPTRRVHTYSDRYEVPAGYEQVTK